ncbi:D-alanyl-D-alanine dipeptidase [Candidatus Marinamargulisbacteria bacterium SCGC AG-414-C22]|nr:D-alanyl-D-alanine dipeptidase [Candidatus Marinamargulisbacteria bacterium SCGC AG-414-C22]
MSIKNSWLIIILSIALTMASCVDEKDLIDPIEQATGLKKCEHKHFMTDLKYNSTDNFLNKNVYQAYNIKHCYVHPDVHEKLLLLTPILAEKKLKLVFYDCYRPIEVQRLMWEILPDSRYVANPKNGSLHNRGIAIDVGLATMTGDILPMPSDFDHFGEQSWHSYEPKDELEHEAKKNKDLLKELCESIGLKPLRTEWWHYHFPNPKSYPIITLDKNGVQKS